MYQLTIIKQNSGSYIDSREVAKAIGKQHKDLLRDIRGYITILDKFTERNLTPSDFFLETSYFDRTGRELPCYLLSKMGCELIANKLIGERGILFTVAYVTRFNELETAEREAEIKAQAKPKLSEFNGAARIVLNGLSQCYATSDTVMKFLRGVYEPLGIKVLPHGYDDYLIYFTATEIAEMLGIYSETGNPHGRAVSAVISKIPDANRHSVVMPYGLSGMSMRYDFRVIEMVRRWLEENDSPREIPHNGFEYHIYYARHLSLFGDLYN